MDQFEVTTGIRIRRSGGYEKVPYWKQDFIDNGRCIAEDAMAQFSTNRRPARRRGKRAYPQWQMTFRWGVSCTSGAYASSEARACRRFTGSGRPGTGGVRREHHALSNYSQALLPVGQSTRSPAVLFDMAGNVKDDF